MNVNIAQTLRIHRFLSIIKKKKKKKKKKTEMLFFIFVCLFVFKHL